MIRAHHPLDALDHHRPRARGVPVPMTPAEATEAAAVLEAALLRRTDQLIATARRTGHV